MAQELRDEGAGKDQPVEFKSVEERGVLLENLQHARVQFKVLRREGTLVEFLEGTIDESKDGLEDSEVGFSRLDCDGLHGLAEHASDCGVLGHEARGEGVKIVLPLGCELLPDQFVFPQQPFDNPERVIQDDLLVE